MHEPRNSWSKALCAALLLWGCGSDHDHDRAGASEAVHTQAGSAAHADAQAAEPDVERFVGAVADSDVRVAAVTHESQARLFFCGGDDSYATATRWYNLDFDGDELRNDDGAWHLTAQRDADGIHGEIKHDPDDAKTFTLGPVPEGSLAGLYEGKAGCGRLGLIVTHASAQDAPEAQGACVGDGHTPEQVNPIEPIESVAGKIRVQAPSEDAQPLLGAAGILPL